MKKLINLTFFAGLLFAVLHFSSCVKQDFNDLPVTGEETGLTANTTIAVLKDQYTSGIVAIDEMEGLKGLDEIIIKGTIVADDRGGNWFRSFIMQDATGGLEVQITLSDAYVFYPVGREVFIKCKGLYLTEDNGGYQLGGYTYLEGGGTEMGAIFEEGAHIFKGTKQADVPAAIRAIGELGPNDINTLVKIENVEFSSADAGQTFSDVVGRAALNRDLMDCTGGSLVVRSSGFAAFANVLTPTGNGSITAIYSVFGTTKQLFIRDTTDLDMTGDRCNGSGPIGNPCDGGGTPVVIESLDLDFNNFSNGQDIFLDGWINVAVSGSRLWRATEFDGNIYAQATAFGDNGGAPMEAWLVTPGIDFDKASKLSFETAQAFWNHNGFEVLISFDFECDVTEATWEPFNVTVANVNSPFHEWIPTGDVDLSSFSGVGHIGFKYVGQGPETQTTSIRIDNFVIGEGGGGGPDPEPCTDVPPVIDEIELDFQNFADDTDVDLEGWTNVAVSGSRVWRTNEFDGNLYAQATAFGDNGGEPMETWLVTPGFDFSTPKKVSLETAQAFWNHDGFDVLISFDFECDVTEATWQELDLTLAASTDPDHDWIPTGDVDMSQFTGVGYIAFRYIGQGPDTETTSIRIDNLVIEDL